MRVSLAQIAKKAGVSTAAVSKALRDHDDIAPATRKRIKELARKMGYRGNFAARVLATRETLTLGLAVAFPQIPTVVERVRGAQQIARDNDYALSVAFHSGTEEDQCAQIAMLHDRVDGIILTAGAVGPQLVALLRSLPVPFVAMSEPLSGLSADYVGGDSVEGGKTVARHFIEQGRRRIAFIGESLHTPSDEAIVAGMRQVCEEAGMALDETLLRYPAMTREATAQAVEELLGVEQPPKAIAAYSDLSALWVLDALHCRGVRVPADIAVAGFDDIEFARLGAVPLTSVAEPNYEVGCRAAQALLERIQARKNDRPPAPPRRIILPCELHVRASTSS